MMGRLESLFFIPSPVGREKVVEDRMRVLICFDARPHLNPLPRGEDFGNNASGDAAIHAHVADLHLVRDAAEGDDGPVLKFKRREVAQLLHRPRQIADDEAASGAPEHSLSGNAQTSRKRLSMTRQAVGEISMPIIVLPSDFVNSAKLKCDIYCRFVLVFDFRKGTASTI